MRPKLNKENIFKGFKFTNLSAYTIMFLSYKPKFGVFALYNQSVRNIINITYSFKGRFVLSQR